MKHLHDEFLVDLTVDGHKHNVLLEDLTPDTPYSIYIEAKARTGSTTSIKRVFTTTKFGKKSKRFLRM